MNQPVLPVLVVGAGPTGLMMANELARHGVPPADHRSRPGPGDDFPRARRPAQDPGDLRRHRRRRPGDRGGGIGVEPDHHICDKGDRVGFRGPVDRAAEPHRLCRTAHPLAARHRTDSDRAVERAGRRDRTRAGTDGSDPGRRDGDRVAARRGWLDRDRAMPVGHRLRRRAQRGAQGGRHPVHRVHVPRRVHHGRRRTRLEVAARRTLRIPQSCRDFRGLLDAGREPLPDLRQLPARARRPERRVQRTHPRRVPGDGR